MYKYIKSSDIIQDYKYFDVIKAETILHFLNKHNKEKFEFDPTKKEGYFTESYIKKLYEFLNVEALMFQRHNNYIAYSMFNHYTNTTLKDIRINLKTKQYIDNKLAKYNSPSVLIVVTDTDNLSNKFYDKYPEYIISNKENTANLLSSNDIIFYNNQEYTLDAVILSNWNKDDYHLKGIGHAIAGITCKNERYVYNGWTRYTLDPNIKQFNNPSKFVSLPCELMKLNWSIKNPNDFCLNTAKCIPDNTNIDKNKDLCFSFNKGKRVLIYVKKNNSNKTSIDDSRSDSIPPPLQIPKTIYEKDCGPGKIYNPITKRCVNKKGAEILRKMAKLLNGSPKEKNCPPGKIVNPLTKRCIKINGDIGKKLVKTPAKLPAKAKSCPPGKIVNPTTNRCVNINGAVAKKILQI